MHPLSKDYLSEDERKVLEAGGLQDIESINRSIGSILTGRQRWTTQVDNADPQESDRPIIIMLVGEAGAGKRTLEKLLLSIGDGKNIILLNTTDCTEYGTLRKMINTKMQGVDVFIMVINNSARRSEDLGIKKLKDTQVLTKGTNKHFMVVATHSKAHYTGKGVDTFLENVKGNAMAKEFLDKIKNRVVMVELGGGPVTAASAKLRTACYQREREQARDMVMSMVYKLIQDNNGKQYTSSTLYFYMMIFFMVGISIYLLVPPFIKHLLSSSFNCFPSTAMVYTPYGKKRMQQLNLNDNVLVVHQNGKLGYEPVIMFSNANPDTHSTFMSIKTKNSKTLNLTIGQLLPTSQLGNLKAAHEVRVGDVVFAVGSDESVGAVPEKVVAVGCEQLSGLYCPHTLSGSIVVDGIVASCYTDVVPTVVARILLVPVRVLYHITPTELFKIFSVKDMWTSAKARVAHYATKLLSIFHL